MTMGTIDDDDDDRRLTKSESEFTERGVQPVNRSFVRASGRGEAAGAGEGRRVAVSRASQLKISSLASSSPSPCWTGAQDLHYEGEAVPDPAHRWTDRWADRWTDRSTDRWTNRWTDRRTNENAM